MLIIKFIKLQNNKYLNWCLQFNITIFYNISKNIYAQEVIKRRLCSQQITPLTIGLNLYKINKFKEQIYKTTTKNAKLVYKLFS